MQGKARQRSGVAGSQDSQLCPKFLPMSGCVSSAWASQFLGEKNGGRWIW